jgi:hypothetical protein
VVVVSPPHSPEAEDALIAFLVWLARLGRQGA